MAEFPIQFLLDVERGNQYLSNLNQEFLSDLVRGCDNCTPDSFECLKNAIRALNYKVELDQYDAVAIDNLNIMLKIIGGYQLVTGPTVSAGAPQVVSIDAGPAVFTANATQGSSPIVSYQWEQTNGTPATLSGANTVVLSVSNFSVGVIGLKVTVVDSNGLTASATTQLTGSNATALIAYFSTGPDFTIPSYQTIIDTWTPVSFQPGGAINFPFIVTDLSIFKVAYPTNQPIKNRWIDINDVLLFGAIGTEEDLWGAGTVVNTLRVHTTNYLTLYNKPNPSGIRFVTI